MQSSTTQPPTHLNAKSYNWINTFMGANHQFNLIFLFDTEIKNNNNTMDHIMTPFVGIIRQLASLYPSDFWFQRYELKSWSGATSLHQGAVYYTDILYIRTVGPVDPVE